MSTEKEGDGSGKGGPFGGIRVFLWAPVTSFPGQNTHNHPHAYMPGLTFPNTPRARTMRLRMISSRHSRDRHHRICPFGITLLTNFFRLTATSVTVLAAAPWICGTWISSCPQRST